MKTESGKSCVEFMALFIFFAIIAIGLVIAFPQFFSAGSINNVLNQVIQ